MHRSVAKIVGILECISATQAGMDFEGISRKLGISRSAAHRALAALIDRGLVVRDVEMHRYRIGPWGLRLARAFADTESLLILSRAHLQRLRDASEETVCLSVLSGGQCVCVEELPSPKIIKFSQGVGATSPLYAGASGKVLLASLPSPIREQMLKQLRLAPITPRTVTEKAVLLRQLEEIQRRGYGVSRGERLVGACAVAAPILGLDAAKVAAIGVFGPDSRLTTERIREIVPLLLETSQAISKDLNAPSPHLTFAGSQRGEARRTAGRGAAFEPARR